MSTQTKTEKVFLLRGEWKNPHNVVKNTIKRDYQTKKKAKEHKKDLEEGGWDVTITEIEGQVEEEESKTFGDMNL